MNGSEFIQVVGRYAVSVLLALASGGAISGAIVFFAREWITVRVKASIEHEYAQKLEAYKAKLNAEHDVAIERLRADAVKERAIRDAAMGNFAAARGAAYERRLKAIEVLWDAICKLRSLQPAIIFCLDSILLPDEYDKVFTKNNMKQALDALSTEKFLREVTDATAEVERYRPFLGELLYSYFWAYRAVVGRASVIVERGRSVGKLAPWFEDPSFRNLAAIVLTKEELAAVHARPFGKLESIQQMIEGKVLTRANQLISGQESADSGLEQARKIEDAIRAVEREDQRRSSLGDARLAVEI